MNDLQRYGRSCLLTDSDGLITSFNARQLPQLHLPKAFMTSADTTLPQEPGATDWAAWSRESVEMMMARNAQWPQQFGLAAGTPYRWDLDKSALVFEGALHEVVATVCLVGTTSESENSFLWSWANDAIPRHHGEALEVVHEFGREHHLALLTTARIPGGRPEATECLCIAARLQRAVGTFVDPQGDVALYFSILHLQIAPMDDQLPN